MEASAVLSAPDTQARKNAKSMTGWMKFMGIMTIIGGALNALSIVGILWAWLPIWLGVVLTQAGTKAGEYAAKGDMASLEAMTGKLKSYFVISGIVTIISMAMSIIGAIVWLVLLGAGLFSMSDVMNRFSS